MGTLMVISPPGATLCFMSIFAPPIFSPLTNAKSNSVVQAQVPTFLKVQLLVKASFAAFAVPSGIVSLTRLALRHRLALVGVAAGAAGGRTAGGCVATGAAGAAGAAGGKDCVCAIVGLGIGVQVGCGVAVGMAICVICCSSALSESSVA